MSRAVFEKIVKSKASKNGLNINPGKYLFEILNVLQNTCHGGEMFIVELKVLEAVQTDEKYVPNKVGSECSWVVKLDNDSGPGDAKAFVMALFAEPEDAITIDTLVQVCAQEDTKDATGKIIGKAQPARFFKIRDTAFNKPQKKKPTEMFTHHKWEHVEASEVEIQDIIKRQDEAAKKAA